MTPERTRISADRYLKMGATGVLTEDDRVELIDGDIINMAPIGPMHSADTARLIKVFVLAVGDSAIVSPGGSLRLGDYSVPQPDLMVLRPRDDFYSRQPWGDRYAQATECTLADAISPRALPVIQAAVGTLFT